MTLFDPWTWRDPAALAGGYSEIPDERLGVDQPAGTEADRGRLDLTGYHVEATDGRIGTVEETGAEHLVVDVGRWIFGRLVLLPAGVVERVDHERRTVHVDRSKDQIKSLPPYDPEAADPAPHRDAVGRWYGDTGPRD